MSDNMKGSMSMEAHDLRPGDWGDDAAKWAEAFCNTFPGVMDEGTMLGWFANAIEIAHDKRVREERYNRLRPLHD